MRSTATTPSTSTSKPSYGKMISWGEVQIDNSQDGSEDIESDVHDGVEGSASSNDGDYSTPYHHLHLNDLVARG